MTIFVLGMSLRRRPIYFIQACEARLPQEHTLSAIRADSASYQADLLNYCEQTCKTFAIGSRLDTPTLAVIAAIPDAAWTHYADCEVAETVHSMERTEQAFRLIVVRYAHQGELLEDDRPRYHVIASNSSGSTADVLVWYRQRGGTFRKWDQGTENRLRDGTDALWTRESQCGFLPDGGHRP